MVSALQHLRKLAADIPLVDQHCHLVRKTGEEGSQIELELAFSEADGHAAIVSALSGLGAIRNTRQLHAAYGLDSQCSNPLDALKKHLGTISEEQRLLRMLSLSNIGSLLIDDGFGDPCDLHDLGWHRSYVSRTYRVVRIERIAEDLLRRMRGGPSVNAENEFPLESFVVQYDHILNTVDAVAFKSIIAYRSGLDISPSMPHSADQRAQVIHGLLESTTRLTCKPTLDFLFLRALTIAVRRRLPMQLHCGLGDRDVDLRSANPLHLRALLHTKDFDQAKIVLLHLAYPYMRECGYLASTYTQIFVDFGLTNPILSTIGLRSCLHELLELCPMSKILYSSDAHDFPEMFYLAATNARAVLAEIFAELVDSGDLSLPEAGLYIRRILALNAVELYGLSPRAACNDDREPADGLCRSLSSAPSSAFEIPEKIEHVRLMWCDLAGIRRCRLLPRAVFLERGLVVGAGITSAVMATPAHHDVVIAESGLAAIGEVRMIPDMATFRALPYCPLHGQAFVDFTDASGDGWDFCPRRTLRRAVKVAKDEFDLCFQAAFESEFYLLHQPTVGCEQQARPVDSTTYCSTASLANSDVRQVLESANRSLEASGICVEQWHAESGPGQFEIAIAHGAPLAAADEQLMVRETLVACAAEAGYRATFLPKVFAVAAGSGSHVHFSLKQPCVASWSTISFVEYGSAPDSSLKELFLTSATESFMAGVLEHLPALLAVTAPSSLSFARLQPGCWSAAFQCWGIQNREAAIRAVIRKPNIEDGLPPDHNSNSFILDNFELEAIDGTCNPHLALSAIIFAGIDGIRRRLRLGAPLQVDPCTLSTEQLSQRGIRRLPRSVEEAHAAFRSDAALLNGFGSQLTTAMLAVRLADAVFLDDRSFEERVSFLLDRF